MSIMCDRSIEGFIQLIARYRPNFPQEIQGASVAQIDAFAELVYQVSALTLPLDYRNFLLRMGVAAPGFVVDTSQSGWGERVPWCAFVEDASPDLESLYEYYSYQLEDGESPPPQCLVVGVFGLHCQEVFLECHKDLAGRVFSQISNSKVFWSESWVGHLYKQAFRYIISNHMQIQAQSLINREAASELAELARIYGLQVMWFSDTFDFCAASLDLEILLYISSYATSPRFYLAGKKQSWSWIPNRRASSAVADFWQFLKRSEVNN
ncbi:hypothetical protein [Dendronalium sp. ChiSLP03b]|uniref:hypothetical protein n=1 Tax=Dendronalium sp. ChiSLP03b TaxID=3075381 RepID=UPI002AD44E04|nr:hypothetical protein [Dendronalium sp. ChiSLP03b]MDZ8208563.1 hypothetical protein [Dendronalium sp. ChiSLP03b]